MTDGQHSDLVNLFIARLPNEAERRRYALLQAAARIAVDLIDTADSSVSIYSAVDFAGDLLAEIERRENDPNVARSRALLMTEAPELLRLLGLIVAEFKSDPMSVQCFDLRIVEAATKLVDKLEGR